MRFDGKVVVITGATSGIGASTARKFAEFGASVVLVGRNFDRGISLCDSIISDGGKAEFFCCDVTVQSDVESLSNMLLDNYHKVDVLFNNAGVMLPSAEIENISIDDWKKTFDTNIDGTFQVTRVLKSLIYLCKGTIINNASIAGMQSYAIGRSYAYSASKAAAIQFTRQMAKNYAKDGVRVNCICPGIIDTPLLGDRDRKIYSERIPLGYVGSPDEVADVVVFLASNMARYITGAVVPVDGGVVL